MLELMLSVALTWPSACEEVGELYRIAAIFRDSGKPLKSVLKVTKEKRVRLALTHVYERQDMTPSDWRWMAIGICVGQSDPSGTRTENVFGGDRVFQSTGEVRYLGRLGP